MPHKSNMQRLEAVVAALPEAEKVLVEEWGDHPTFRVRGKSFVFCNDPATHMSVKLTKEEAVAVVATDPAVEPAGYCLGRHGWIAWSSSPAREQRTLDRGDRVDPHQLHLVAPKTLARVVIAEDEGEAC